MRKSILILMIVVLSSDLIMAQFICNISSKVKDVANEIVSKGTSKSDDLIIGDYRLNGTGMILLPDHTGAYSIQNVQVSDLIWVLVETNGNLTLLINVYENELNLNGELQINTQNIFLVNIKSDTLIELLDIKTTLTLTQYRSKLIPGKVYSQIRKIENQNKAKESFSVFAKKYIDENLVKWLEKGDYEKTVDWQTRVNDETRKRKVAELTDDAIEKYSKWALRDVLGEYQVIQGFGDGYIANDDEKDIIKYFFKNGKSQGKYNADTEIYTLNIEILGTIPLKMTSNEAEVFDQSHINMNDVVFYIQDDQVALAEATFNVENSNSSYKYINPNAVNRIKTKFEISHIQKQEGRKQYLQAKKLYDKSEYKEAILCYEKVIELYPLIMNSKNFNDLGTSYFELKEYSKGIEFYKKALALDSITKSDVYRMFNIKTLYFNLGFSYYVQKDFQNAISALTKSVEIKDSEPNDGIVYGLLGQIYFDLKDFVNSIESYHLAIRYLNKNDEVVTYNKLGELYCYQGDYENALKVLGLAFEIDPNCARTYYNLGNAYLLKSNRGYAKKMIKKAAKLGDKGAQEFLEKQQINW